MATQPTWANGEPDRYPAMISRPSIHALRWCLDCGDAVDAGDDAEPTQPVILCEGCVRH